MLDGAQVLDSVALLLQRVVGSRGALDLDGKRLELEGLLGTGRQHKLAGHDEGGADVLRNDLVIVGQDVAAQDDLKVVEAAAVVESNESHGFGVTDGARPSRHGQRGSPKAFGVSEDAGDGCTVHS